jgi:polysaccharide deacetylase 2 family uncharacterized protein YibQ
MMINRLLRGLALACLICVTPAQADNPVVSIIIDDMGYRLQQDRDALMLAGSLTYSVLPHAPGARRVLQAAKANGNEVMLHLPMESETRSRLPSPGVLTRSMDWITFVRTVQKDLAAVPGIVAINNHEGSRLTADTQRMQWLMEELSRHDIAFIDSRTTHHTVALQTAEKYGLPATRRDIFLDYEPGKIEQQFKKLISKAKKEGSALAIAHPRDETIEYLNAHLGELKQQGIDLVPVSRLISIRQQDGKLAGGNNGESTDADCGGV